MQRYFAKEKVANEFVLYDSDIHHIKNVMRYVVSDEIEVVYDDTIYLCQIKNLTPLSLEIIETYQSDSEMNISLTLAISLVNEQKMDLILQKLTELGVSSIIPVKTERSIVKLDEKKAEKKLFRWQMICKEASEQSKRTKIPNVEEIVSINELSKMEYDIKFICSLTDNSKSLKECLSNNKYKRILFTIGPEGGFTKEEETKLIDSGFIPITLGKRVMRVETAAIYVSSIINYICEE